MLLRGVIVGVLAGLLAGCGSSRDDSVVDVAFLAEPGALTEQGLRLSSTAQHVRAATREGLVSMNATGEVVPAIAERWIVTDDGLSYIFRLRNSDWPDGEPITGEAVRDRLRAILERLEGTSLGLDLAKVVEIRAMTGRVIEIRLSSPMPNLLQLMAQPELGLDMDGSGTGPFALAREDGVAVLNPVPPSTRGLPQGENWRSTLRQLRIHALSPERAVDAFEVDDVNVVLGGRLANLPYADIGSISRATIRLDPALGLFGLQVRNEEGFLASVTNREAIAMAIDRNTLLETFSIGGWVPTTRVAAPDLPGDDGSVSERWQSLSIDERRAVAARRVAAWEAANGGDLVLAIHLPEGIGSDRLFDRLARDLGAAGIGLRRVANLANADLELKDRVARFAGVRWFLNQFNCRITSGPCSAEADALVRDSLDERDPAAEARQLAAAERVLADANVFIPFGAPIRWSLVRADVDGFEENRWGIHPLFPLAERPI